MHVVQCDGPSCRKLGPQDAFGWFVLVQMPGRQQNSVLSILGGPQPEPVATFCSMVCLGEYARARALTDSVETGEGQ